MVNHSFTQLELIKYKKDMLKITLHPISDNNNKRSDLLHRFVLQGMLKYLIFFLN